MMELKVILDFACCICNHSVSVTVKCEGKPVALAGRPVASVNVPCPNCGQVNKLTFEPNGTVRAVAAVTGDLRVPQPSLN